MNIARVVKGLGAECIVRLGQKNLEAIYRVLDMGVDGVLLPNVGTPEEAQMIVDAVKYPPEGRRGCCPITRAANYGVNTDVLSYYKEMNKTTTVGLMIESKKGYENLDKLMKVKGIDFFTIGPSDFSGSFGKPGQASTDPEIKAAMNDTWDRLLKHGFNIGSLAYTPEQAATAVKAGKTFLNVGSDLQMLTKQIKQHVDGARKAFEARGYKGSDKSATEKLRSGEPVIAQFIRIAEPTIAEIMALSGVDFVLVDDEHYPFTDRDIINIVRVVHARGGKVIVRPHDKSKAAIGRIMDMGADGIMAAQVQSAEEARKIVSYVKYSPMGVRGFCPISAGAAFGFGSTPDMYTVKANKESVVGIMIETKAAVEDLDAILSVPGIDYITVGPSDLSASYGIPGQYDNPELKAVMENVFAKVKKAGIPLMGFAYDNQAGEKCLDDGKNVLLTGSDVQYMVWGWTDLIAKIKNTIKGHV